MPIWCGLTASDWGRTDLLICSAICVQLRGAPFSLKTGTLKNWNEFFERLSIFIRKKCSIIEHVRCERLRCVEPATFPDIHNATDPFPPAGCVSFRTETRTDSYRTAHCPLCLAVFDNCSNRHLPNMKLNANWKNSHLSILSRYCRAPEISFAAKSTCSLVPE